MKKKKRRKEKSKTLSRCLPKIENQKWPKSAKPGFFQKWYLGHFISFNKLNFMTKNHKKWPNSAKREFSQQWCLGQFIPSNAL